MFMYIYYIILTIFFKYLRIGSPTTIEEVITEELEANPSPLGRSYPFKSGKIKADSPLGRLLRSKGITPENSNQFEGSQDW
jgi:hypothetical protein